MTTLKITTTTDVGAAQGSKALECLRLHRAETATRLQRRMLHLHLQRLDMAIAQLGGGTPNTYVDTFDADEQITLEEVIAEEIYACSEGVSMDAASNAARSLLLHVVRELRPDLLSHD